MNLIESTNNNQMEMEFAGQMVERHDVPAPSLLEVGTRRIIHGYSTESLTSSLQNFHKS